MTVSVVICSYNSDRWHDLAAAVRSCADQTRPPDQVVVVIDHNEPLLHRAVLELEGAVVLANRFSRGLSGARNTGIACSTGDVVAFLDDDAYADPQWLANLVGPMADPSVAGVGGWVLPHWETARPEWFPEAFYWVLGCSYVGLPTTDGHLRNPIGANMAIRRRVFRSVGGFASGLGRIGKVPLGCEETELCIRYTGRFPDQEFVLARDAVVHHRVPAWRLTWHYFWTRCWAEGISKAAVSSLVGPASGLAAERHYLARSLPRAYMQSVRSLPRHPRSASARAGLMVTGTVCAAVGLLWGRMALRVSPIDTRKDDLGLRDLDHLLQPFEAVDVASEADTRASVLR
ncbi:MAG: glycosyltransferase family 2 protein [Acidimicrobiales bacterium]|jgi:hypothetical protein